MSGRTPLVFCHVIVLLLLSTLLVARLLWSFVSILILSFLLIDHQLLGYYIVRLSPLPDRQVRHLIQKFRDMAGRSRCIPC